MDHPMLPRPIDVMEIASRIRRAYERSCQPVCRKYGLNQTSFDMLMFFANNPGYNTARDICRYRGIKSGIASVMVEKLRREGLLVRRTDPDDRRIQRLEPTQKAVPIVEEGREMQRNFGAAILRGIPGEDRETFQRFARLMAENAEKLEKI